MRLIPVIAAAVSMVLALGFGSVARSEVAGPRPEKADLARVAAGGNAFAFDLLGKLNSDSKNLFFSPYSIRVALAMTYAGARGNTEKQMSEVLQFGLPQKQLHPAMAALIHDLNSSGKVGNEELYRLIVANAIWSQAGYPFHKDFENVVQANYGSTLHQVDFLRATEAARQQINAWAAKQTNDKIKDLVPQGVLSELTRLVLTNAVYFKSNWEHQFSKRATKQESFHLAPDQTATVPMMHENERFGYAETDQFQAVELPYRGHRLSMVIILPRKVDGLAAVEKGLTSAGFEQLLTQLKSRKVDLSLPRFKMTSQFDLAKTLAAMGMPDAFSEAADFSGIATVNKLLIQSVIHKAYVDLNEEGTEAAAATAVAIGLTAMPQPEEPVVFRADHPFLFFIRHQASNEILFVGHLVTPAN